MTKRKWRPPAATDLASSIPPASCTRAVPIIGVFLQITSEDINDIEIPGEKFTFGVLKQAQALGDFESLVARHSPHHSG